MTALRSILLIFLVGPSFVAGFVPSPTRIGTNKIAINTHGIQTQRSIVSYPSRYNQVTLKANVDVNSANDNDQDVDSTVSRLPSAWIFAGVPLLSISLPLLLQAKLIGPLLIAKRLYVYTLPATVVIIASLRGANDATGLGTRLIDLTREILPSYNADFSLKDDTDNDQRFQELELLDEVDDSTQAIGLPLVVVSSLVTSLFFVLLKQTDLSTVEAVNSMPFLETFQSFLPQLVTASNGFVLSLFARVELKRILGNDTAAIGTSVVLTLLSYFGPAGWVWPIQNILCVCLAISVSRAIQITRLGPILLALMGLVLYDVASVGVQLINLGSAAMEVAASSGVSSETASTAASTSSAGASAMGAVALSKTNAGAWQPGLFQVRLRGIATDLLGLGDSVFPSLLSTFCLRFDQAKTQEGDDNESSSGLDLPTFPAAMLGFGAGCLACEFAPGIGESGLPALLFIVPAMLTSVGLTLLLSGQAGAFWAFDASEGDSDTV